MNKNRLIYWVSTALILFTVGLGSFADFLKIDAIKESFQHIGFPEYIIPFLGTMKLLGSITIVLPAAKRLQEAAYAGIIYYFIGATYCHLAVGDGVDKWGMTVFILLATIVSYRYKPA